MTGRPMTAPNGAPRRVAAIDVGTNTAQLVVAERAGDGLTVLADAERFVRLGQGVDATRRLAPEAVERVMAALRDYRAIADAWGAEAVTIGATSASRDAANRDELVERVWRELGWRYDTISGEEEALWSFRGATSVVPAGSRVAIVDVGGGSTEVVTGTAGGAVETRQSVDVGSVRVTERFFSSLPPTGAEVEAAEAFVAERLAGVAADAAVPLVGASGTTRVLGALAHPDDPYAFVSAGALRTWRDRLLALSAAEVRALDPERLAGRADVFAGGVLVLEAVVRRLGAAGFQPSPRGLRHGLALRFFQHAERAER